ncbi:MAG: TolC family protein [Muribaculaceae bacterium]
MNFNSPHRLSLAAAVIAIMPLLHAQEQEVGTEQLPLKWSYEQCVDYARSHNIKLQQSVLTQRSSTYDIQAAKGGWLPSLSFSTSQNYSNYPHTGNSGNSSNTYSGTYGLNAAWTMLDGGQRTNSIKRAQTLNQAYEYTVQEQDDNLRLQILQYYLQIMYAKEAIEIANKNLEVSKQEMERAKQLMESGRLSRVDYVQLESQYHNDLYNVTSAQTNLASQKSALKQLLQLGIAYDIELQDVTFTEEQVLQAIPNKEQVYAQAISWMPALKGSQLQQQISEYDINIAKSSIKPKVSVNASAGTNHATGMGKSFGDQLLDGLHENIGLTLSVPIFDQNSTKSQVAKAKIAKLNAELDTQQMLQDISQNVETCYLEAINAQAKYISGKKTLASAELTDQLTNEQFRIGKVNTLDLLSSHATLANARQELLQLKYLAILNLKMLQYYQNNQIILP